MFQSVYDLHSGCLPIEDRITPDVLANILFRNTISKHGDSMSQKDFILTATNSRTMRSLLEGTTEAASQPYTSRVGRFERRRTTSGSKSKAGRS